ncbi:hypothetical protein AGMMS49950_04310 [Endomicrobiia bacterium]|nr:hypothetical protein AGMMS49531_11430 [Endomicrobiia bacterium]GHT70098.1 hypothetical protein AGMMS49950_04310 [Endomicrobiia bacterium]
MVLSSCDKKNAFLVNRRTATPEKVKQVEEAQRAKEREKAKEVEELEEKLKRAE